MTLTARPVACTPACTPAGTPADYDRRLGPAGNVAAFSPDDITGLYQWLYDGATTPVEQTSAITGSPTTVVNSRAITGVTGDRRELRAGRGGTLDGTADYYEAASNITGDSAISTMSAVVEFDISTPPTTNPDTLLAEWTTATANRRWLIQVEATTGYLQFLLSSDGTNVDKEYEVQTNLCDGARHSAGFSFSSGTLSVMVDGAAATVVKTTDNACASLHSNSVAHFGTAIDLDGTPANITLGNIHTICVTSDVMAESEFLSWHNSHTQPDSQLGLYWLEAEGGSVELDASGNGNTLTVNGTIGDVHQANTAVTYSAANSLGHTVADGSTMYAEAGLSTLLTAGTIIPRDESNPTKCCAYNSGGQVDLQYTGQAPYYGTIIQSGALQGDGAADHATVPQAVLDAIEGSATATLVMWGDRQSAGNDLFFGIGDGTTNNRIVIAPFNDGEVYAIVGNGSNSYGQVTDNNTGPICWVLVFDGGQTGNANRLKLYKNGGSVTLSFTGTIPATLPATLSVGRMGRHTASAIYADGIQWCHAVYSDALSAAEVLALYESGTYPTDNLEALYPCSEMNTAETTVYDVSGNERHATISGTTADVRAGRQDAIAWNQLHGFSKSGSTYIPGFNGLKPDGVTATDSAPGATADVFHLDGSQLDRSGGVTTPLARNVNAIDTSYEVGDGQINPEFVRETATTADRLLAYEAALTGDDLTNVNDYTT